MSRPSMPDPGQIVRLTTAFWDSQSLLTASPVSYTHLTLPTIYSV